MKVTIYGSGYVGLVTGACLADVGNQVLCVDIDEAKIADLKKGRIPIHEPGLDKIVLRNLDNGRLRFTTDAAEGTAHSDIQMIAVGTPPDEDGSADLQYVLAVAESIASHMDDHKIIVNKSTVPVGTGDKVRDRVRRKLDERGSTLTFDVASNPEFLKEGAAINDFTKPDRIVVGAGSEQTSTRLLELYSPFNRNHDRILVMDVRSAELTKYAANSLLATKISFMNELSNIAEKLGADIEQVRVGIGSDPRIGYQFIYPGCGFGGSCFPKDLKALASTARQVDISPQLIDAVIAVNEKQKQVLFNKINRFFAGQLDGKVIAVWGLAFKPNTDDMREASSRVLLQQLFDAGARVRAYDPVASNEARRIYGESDRFRICASAGEAVEQADALAIVTEWSEFRSPDFDLLKSTLRQAVIFDGRNLYEPDHMKNLGFSYFAIGRGEND